MTTGSKFANLLIEWFKHNARVLPWRQQRDWYRVFLSEILLQQTQVQQALPYFEKIYRRFPDIESLARADEDELLQLWAGLGYYSRGRNLLKAARIIVEKYQGNFPIDYHEALKLPGIGPYTASAILSIAFNQPLPVVDGNVLRVMTRVTGIEDDIRSTQTKNKIHQELKKFLPPAQAALFNEGLMELGARVCKPQNPLCAECPVAKLCFANLNNVVEKLPFKSAAPNKKERFEVALVILNKGKIFLVQRPGHGLLAKMWQFPVLSLSRQKRDVNRLVKNWFKQTGISGTILQITPALKHVYSHIVLHYRAVLTILDNGFTDLKIEGYPRQGWYTLDQAVAMAVHGAHKKIFERKEFKEWLIVKANGNVTNGSAGG